MKKVDSEVLNKYTKIMQQNELSTNSAYPEIEIIKELDNIKRLKEQQKDSSNVENENSENNEEKIDLSEISDEEIDSLYINMEFLGLNLAQVPTNSNDWKAYIIPALYVIVSIISLRISNPTKKKKNSEDDGNKSEEEFDPMAQMNKNMNLIFPIMYLAVALIAPLGLALYWLMNSLLMIIEKFALNKMLKDEEE